MEWGEREEERSGGESEGEKWRKRKKRRMCWGEGRGGEEIEEREEMCRRKQKRNETNLVIFVNGRAPQHLYHLVCHVSGCTRAYKRQKYAHKNTTIHTHTHTQNTHKLYTTHTHTFCFASSWLSLHASSCSNADTSYNRLRGK